MAPCFLGQLPEIRNYLEEEKLFGRKDDQSTSDI